MRTAGGWALVSFLYLQSIIQQCVSNRKYTKVYQGHGFGRKIVIKWTHECHSPQIKETPKQFTF